jgi:hypothetical protein
MKPNLITRLLAGLLVLGMVAAACSGDTSDSGEQGLIEDFGAENAVGAPTAGEPAEAESPNPSRDLGDGSIVGAQVPVNLGRDIIFTATMTVAVNNVSDASSQAISVIESFNGFLFGQDTVGLPTPRTVLVFKVPPNQFQAALADLGSVGEIRSQSVNADDVTERVVDLESRISTAAASVARLQALLEAATDIEQVVELENELLERETQLETLRGSLRTLSDAVDLATITLTITEALSQPAFNVTVTAYPGHEDGGASCPGSQELAVDQGDEATTVCYEILNIGDTPLTQFTVQDPVIDVAVDDMIVVFGSLEDTLEPGQSVILAAEVMPERRTRTQTRITATAVDQDGNPVAGRTISNTSSLIIDVVDPGGLPGFSDGLDSGWELLQITWSAGNVLVGFIIGLAPILVLIAGFLFWRRQKRRDSGAHAAGSDPTSVPPPPPGAPAGTGIAAKADPEDV